MMAARTSLAAFRSLSLAKWATYCTEASPKRPLLVCGRKVYWRFRSLKTASAMAVVIHRNRFWRSTFSASGTAWALE
jgi:hypothetical protein